MQCSAAGVRGFCDPLYLGTPPETGYGVPNASGHAVAVFRIKTFDWHRGMSMDCELVFASLSPFTLWNGLRGSGKKAAPKLC